VRSLLRGAFAARLCDGLRCEPGLRRPCLKSRPGLRLYFRIVSVLPVKITAATSQVFSCEVKVLC
jgi:hypothetical protein